MEDDVFCKIVRGELPSEKIYEDDKVIVIKDANPIAKIHWLAIPKKHVLDIMEADNELISHIFDVIRKVAKESSLAEDGFRVTTNIGEDGGQAVKHLHFHIMGGEKLPTRSH